MSPVGTAPAMHNSAMHDSEDTEITLGTGKMLALFFALVILCATFFGMGYSLGRNSQKSTAELLPSPSTSRVTHTAQPASNVISPLSSQPATGTKAPDQPNSSDANAGAAPASSQSSDPPEAQTGVVPQPTASYFVQVAAVSKQEDAEALVESLKGRQYQAFIADPSGDKLFHVQVGPFTDVKEAESMRTRLVNDGYNPILKK